jgi:tetratricopeptide (TPR) repeat protein
MAMIGPALIGAHLFLEYDKIIWRAIYVGVLTAWAFMSWSYCGCWKNTFTIMSKAIETTPTSSIALLDIGNYYLDHGDNKKALDFYNRTIASRPDMAKAYGNAANAYMRMDDYENSAAMYLKAIGMGEGNFDIHQSLASAYVNLGEGRPAFNEYSVVLRLKPDASKVQYGLGQALMLQGKWKAAQACFQKEILSNPNYASAYIGAAIALEKCGDTTQAAADFAHAHKLEPTKLKWLEDCAVCRTDSRDYDLAGQLLKEAKKIEPKAPLLDTIDKRLTRNMSSYAIRRAIEKTHITTGLRVLPRMGAK